jgi:hypothetical protein
MRHHQASKRPPTQATGNERGDRSEHAPAPEERKPEPDSVASARQAVANEREAQASGEESATG